MAETTELAGLALTLVGIGALFTTCIEALDIVVAAQDLVRTMNFSALEYAFSVLFIVGSFAR